MRALEKGEGALAHHFGRARLRGRSISEAGRGRRGGAAGGGAFQKRVGEGGDGLGERRRLRGEGELARHFGRARRRGDAVGVAAFQKREGEGRRGWASSRSGRGEGRLWGAKAVSGGGCVGARHFRRARWRGGAAGVEHFRSGKGLGGFLERAWEGRLWGRASWRAILGGRGCGGWSIFEAGVERVVLAGEGGCVRWKKGRAS